jgi:hypothetical protein
MGVAAVCVVLAATGAGAHHSIAAAYDSTKRVTITGVVRAFHFVNPHPWLELDVPDDAGRARTWRLEMDNRFELVGIGMDENTLKPGDAVVASGSASKDAERSLYVRALERPADGLYYEQVGTEPRLRRTSR